MSRGWKMRHQVVLGFLLLAGLLFLLCFPFFNNPYIFDDTYLLSNRGVVNPAPEFGWFSPRWWVYESFFWGAGSLWEMRLGNLVAHFLVCISLFALMRSLIVRFCSLSAVRASNIALGVAVLFAFHPIAIFTQAYLIQRSILFATFFSLLSLLCFWRGLEGRVISIWGSVILFLVAMLSKEHVVMLPAIAILLVVLRFRSGFALGLSIKHVVAVLIAQLSISVLFLLIFKWLLASAYEPGAGEVLEGELSIPGAWLYPLSVLNQMGLFFKYLGLWVLPNPLWLSIDMREAFPPDFSSAEIWVGAGAFVGYCVAGLALLWRGGRIGLVGFGLLLPAVLFCTEFSTVRLQESFVIYRSYVWAVGVFMLLAVALAGLRARVFGIACLSLSVFYLALSFDRLTAMSSDLSAWSDAKDLMERRDPQARVLGAYRIYYNVGVALADRGKVDEALRSYNETLSRKPRYVPALLNRGIILLDRQDWASAYRDFDAAIQAMPQFIKPYIGRGKALQGMGRESEGRLDLERACDMGARNICVELSGESS